MFRRTGHTDDRRRRVLTEEVVGGAAGRSATAARPAGDPHANLYADAAKVENHRRLSDLIPRRMSIVSVLAVLGGAAIGSLVALHHWARTSSGALATALDLERHGSIGRWLGATWMLTAAAISLLLFSLRRHKQSDYHGRYRVWLWTALAAVGMSLCSAAPVHQVMAEQLAMRTAWQLPGGTLLFWLLPLGGLLAVLAVRLLLEIRTSRLALTALLLAMVCHAAGLTLSHTGGAVLSESVSVLAAGGSQMAGHFLLLLGLLLFARHVLLEIEGRLPRREKSEPKVKPAAATASKPADSLSRKIDPPHETPPAPSVRQDASARNTSRRLREEADEEEEWYESQRHDRKKNKHHRAEDDERDEQDLDDEESDGGRKLSKAERKRLRRLKAQQRHSEFS